MVVTWLVFFICPSLSTLQAKKKIKKQFCLWPYRRQPTSEGQWKLMMLKCIIRDLLHVRFVGQIRHNTWQLAATSSYVFCLPHLLAMGGSAVSAVYQHDHRHHPGLMPPMPSCCEIFRMVRVVTCVDMIYNKHCPRIAYAHFVTFLATW